MATCKTLSRRTVPWQRRLSRVPGVVVVAATVAAVTLLLSSAALADPVPAVVHQLQTNGRGAVIPDYTLGWDFQVAQEVRVFDLGFFDMLETTAGSIGDGLFEAHAVGIWLEDGTLVVSAVVPDGVQADEQDGFRYVAVPEVVLAPGVTYVIGAHYPSSCNFSVGGAGDCVVTHVPAGILTPPKFSWTSPVVPGGRRYGEGFSAPLGTGGEPALGPTFRFELGAAPPPPPPPPPGETVLLDPAGDFQLLAGPLPPGAVAPDLVRLAAGFTASHLIVTVEFAPGTLQSPVGSAFYLLGLDLDLNLTTGGATISGADALLIFASDLSYATICRETISPETCGAQVPVFANGDELQLDIPLDASGLDDDGVARFGFVAGLFDGGVPIAEDAAFDGASGSLQRNLLMVSGSLLAPQAVPVLGPVAAMILALGLVITARRAVR